ncbi:MAG: hypothetical protein IJZ17_04175 [Muribaculaceae bacterium]|nr:hypothetical protein [Muribaculaceae bacterium]
MAVALASCVSSDNDDTMTIRYDVAMLNGSINSNGSTFVCSGVMYRLLVDYISATAELEIEGVKFSEKMPMAVTMSVSGLSVAANTDGALVVTGSNLIPTVSGKAMPEFTINSLKMVLASENNAYVEYSVMGANVVATNIDQYFFGQTTVSSTGGTFVTDAKDKNVYSVKIDPVKMTADIHLLKANFASGMPTFEDMVFPSVTVKLVPGGYTLTAESLIPKIANTAYPGFEITDLSAMVSTSGLMSIQYTCGTLGTVTSTLKSVYIDKSTN